MLGWIKRLLGMPASTRVDAGRAPPASQPRPPAPPPSAPDVQGFDWTSLSEFPASERVEIDPDPFDELPDWIDAVRRKSEASWEGLAAFPPIATRIFSLLEHDDFVLQDLVNLIHQDPTITAEVLKAANSAIYARATRTLDIRDAVQRLGAREVAGIAVAASTWSLFDLETRAASDQFGVQARRLWHHSMTCAFTAGWLAMDRGRGSLDRSFLGGMLHDVGKTVALRSVGALIMAGTFPMISDDKIARVLEAVHTSIGPDAIRRWSLPEFFAHLCASHHGAIDAAQPVEPDFHVVRLVSGMNEIRVNPRYLPGVIDDVAASAAQLQLTGPAITYVLTQLGQYGERADQLNLDGADRPEG